MAPHPEALAARLWAAGCVAAAEEAGELLARAGDDDDLLDALVARRITGEPLAWITGNTIFCGLTIGVDHGVYVPRWQTEVLARRAVERLPATGTAIDVCTGTGAIAKTLFSAHPRARIIASDIDPRAVACARANGVETFLGNLLDPMPAALAGAVDVVVGVVPYVPTQALRLLPRDTLAFESPRSYDGGEDGAGFLRQVIGSGARFLRQGGALLLELGGEQADLLAYDLARLGFVDVSVLVDDDGDVCGIEATLGR